MAKYLTKTNRDFGAYHLSECTFFETCSNKSIKVLHVFYGLTGLDGQLEKSVTNTSYKLTDPPTSSDKRYAP